MTNINNQLDTKRNERNTVKMSHLTQPAPLELKGNVAENWKKFKQKFTLYNVPQECLKKKTSRKLQCFYM